MTIEKSETTGRSLSDGRAPGALAAELTDGPRVKNGPVDPAKLPGSWVISDETRRALGTCELFKDFTREQLMQVAALVEERTVEPNEPLLEEGEPAQRLMIVVEGQAVARLSLNQGFISLGMVGPGDVAGWSSLLDGHVYPASVVALTSMRVATIGTSGLSLLMNLDPAIGYPVHRRLSAIFFRQYRGALQAIKTAM